MRINFYIGNIHVYYALLAIKIAILYMHIYIYNVVILMASSIFFLFFTR